MIPAPKNITPKAPKDIAGIQGNPVLGRLGSDDVVGLTVVVGVLGGVLGVIGVFGGVVGVSDGIAVFVTVTTSPSLAMPTVYPFGTFFSVTT